MKAVSVLILVAAVCSKAALVHLDDDVPVVLPVPKKEAAESALLFSRPPSSKANLTINHPKNGSIVTIGSNIFMNLEVDSGEVGNNVAICIRIEGRTAWMCLFQYIDIHVALIEPGPYHVSYLVFEYYGEKNDAAVKTVSNRVNQMVNPEKFAMAYEFVQFRAEPQDYCANNMNTNYTLDPTGKKCGFIPRNCVGYQKFRFFLYEASTVASSQAADVYYTLRDSSFRTLDPTTACVFIAVGDIGVANVEKLPLLVSSKALTSLPYWGRAGENHLILHYGDYSIKYDTGRAMVGKSSFGRPLEAHKMQNPHPELLPKMQQARSNYDIVIPMSFFRCNQGDYVHLERFQNSTIKPAIERSIMLSFKGAVYTMYDTHPSTPRQTLKQFHNGKDIIVALTCWADSVSCEPCIAPECLTPKTMRAQTSTHAMCSTWTDEAAKYDFDELLLDSKFTVVLPGEGAHSYRLYEALQAGSIPVVLGESLLPMEHLIEWNRIAVIQRDASPQGIQVLVDALRGATPQQLADMQANGRRVFDANLKNLKQQLHSVFADITLMMAKEVNKTVTKAQAANNTTRQTTTTPPPATATAATLGTATAAAARNPASAPAAADAGDTAQGTKVSKGNQYQAPTGTAATRGIEADATEDIELQAAFSHYRAGEAAMAALLPDGANLRPLSLNEGAASHHATHPTHPRHSTHVPHEAFKHVETAVSELLLSIQHALLTPHAARKGLISNSSYYLSFLYSVCGMWRLATTAASASVVLSSTISPSVLLRVRNSFFDMRRPVNPPAMQHEALHWRAYRPDEGPFEFDEPTLSGYDLVSHFLSPLPFASIGAGKAAILPIALPPAPVVRPVSSLMSAGLVSEHILQRIAAKVQHKLSVEFVHPGVAPPPPPPAGTKPKIAIVSMCAYDDTKTVLTKLSTANLERYCSLHRGKYACILHSSVVDSSRTPAWSKMLLVARYLPEFEWVMWKDCDSFFMRQHRPVEDILAAAMAARTAVANAAGDVLTEMKDNLGNHSPVVVGDTSMDLIISEDALMLNTGVFFIRNTEWALNYLRRAYGDATAPVTPLVTPQNFGCRSDSDCQKSQESVLVDIKTPYGAAFVNQTQVRMLSSPLPFDSNNAWEQGSIFIESLLRGVSNQKETDTQLYADVARMQFVPQRWINSYPYELAAKLHDHRAQPLHAVYAQGDWIISFSGCGPLLSPARCEELFQLYGS